LTSGILKVLKIFKIVTDPNDYKSVAFVMYSLISSNICWKAIVNLHNFIANESDEQKRQSDEAATI